MLNWESLFILSRLNSCWSMNSPVEVNPHGSTEKVKLLLNSSHLEPQAGAPNIDRGPRAHLGRGYEPLPDAPNVKVVL
jgi:hypothetical protein